MKTVLIALMAGSATAFAPAAQTTTSMSSTSLSAMPPRLWDDMVDKSERSKAIPFLPRPANLDGSMAGDVGFDPFYLSSIPKDFAGFMEPPSWDSSKPGIPTLYWMRESELKHGRIAMLAVAGWVATDFGIRFPGSTFSTDSISAAYFAHDKLVEQGTMTVMLLAVGFIEFVTGAALVQVAKGELEGREPGDYNFDPLKMYGKTEEAKNTMKLKEVKNGRLAMLAFGGIATQTALEGSSHAFPYF